MKFYRRLKPFKAISFDLDDTLYSNYPVMLAVDAKMKGYFSKTLSHLQNDQNTIEFGYQFWFPFRQQVLTENAALIHDVVELRLETYVLGMKVLGMSDVQAKLKSQQALDYFIEQRSDFVVPSKVHKLLAALQQKWPLVAISNGNVDTQLIGLAPYFSAVFHAGKKYQQKPTSDMFLAACETLSINSNELLHVGDCGNSDIAGGIAAGCQTAWLSCYDVGKPLSVLPNIELSDVVELHHLL